MKRITLFSLLMIATFSLTSCEAVGNIFEAGFNVGVFVVIAAIVLVIFLVVKMFSGKK